MFKKHEFIMVPYPKNKEWSWCIPKTWNDTMLPYPKAWYSLCTSLKKIVLPCYHAKKNKKKMVSPFKCKKNILIPQYILLVRFIRQGEQSTAPESVVRRLSARPAQGVEKTTRVKCSPPPHSPFLPRKLLKPITLCHNLISTALQAVSDAF